MDNIDKLVSNASTADHLETHLKRLGNEVTFRLNKMRERLEGLNIEIRDTTIRVSRDGTELAGVQPGPVADEAETAAVEAATNREASELEKVEADAARQRQAAQQSLADDLEDLSQQQQAVRQQRQALMLQEQALAAKRVARAEEDSREFLPDRCV